MAPQKERAWLSALELAQQEDVSTRTAVRWISAHGLGRKVGGRWRADLARVKAFTTLTTGATDDQRRV